MSDKMTNVKWNKIVADMLAEWHRVDSGHEMRRYAVLWWDDRKGLLVHWYDVQMHAYNKKALLPRGSFVTIVDWKAERERKAQEAA